MLRGNRSSSSASGPSSSSSGSNDRAIAPYYQGHFRIAPNINQNRNRPQQQQQLQLQQRHLQQLQLQQRQQRQQQLQLQQQQQLQQQRPPPPPQQQQQQKTFPHPRPPGRPPKLGPANAAYNRAQQPTSAPAPEPAPAQPSFQLPLSVATLSTEPAALPFQQSFTFIQTMPNQNAIISEAPAFQLIQYPPPPLPFSGPVTLFAQPAIFNYGQFPNYVTQPFYPPVNGANEHNANHSQISNASTQTCETLNENETPGEAEEETSDQTASREEAAQQQQITVDDAQQTSNLISNNDNQSSVDDQQSNADNDVRAPSTSLTQTSGFWSENEAYEFVEAADQKANDNDEKQQIISEMSNLTSNATETTSSLYDNQQSNTDDCCTQTAIPSIHVPKHLNQLAISNNGSNNDQNLKQTDKKKDQLKLTSTTTALVECITIYDSEDESNGESDDCQIIDPPDYGSVSKQSNADNENQAAEHSNAGQQINKQKEDKQQQKEQLGTVENANLSTFCAPSEHSADYSQPSNEGNVEPSAAAVVTVNRTSSPSLFLNEQSQNVATENDVENSCSQRTGEEEEEEEDEEERNQQQKQQKTVFSTSLPATKYCRFCGKSFTAYRFLRNHDRVHTRLKPFQCLVCQHSSAQEANIWTHILAQHYQQYLKTKKSLCRPDQAALCQESAELTRWLTSDEHRSWAAADSAAAAAAAAQEEASSCEQNQSLKPKRISMSLRSQSSQSDDDANASGSSGKSKDTEPENNNSSSCVSFDNHLSQSSVHNQASTPPPPLPPSSSSQSTEETNSVFKTSRQGKSYISKFFICRQAGCQ
ncbi:PREDICTED: probable serine/threonine-protein kinase tsuA, partial [Rhagoletis zephyria]|uniref:probable serine/threonine-protein kinase tsuA n=1 Tax=Rhagoletis zephyria TaxID=28612 RepID=UPI0008112359